jgi:eukaryotic-like serine/threonine-protein kinase
LPLQSGQRIGPYEIVSAIGAGGMGEVYRAHDTKLGRDVAIKVLPEALSASPDALARFEREARAIAALSHPNILAIHDFGRVDGVSYAVMELLEGEPLRQAIGGGALPPRRAVDYAAQVARGLAAAHDKGIVHRDLKPENLFVTVDGRVKILDFGLARQDPIGRPAGSFAPTVNSPTEPGTVLGTVGYMAPEQVRGSSVDSRADIFSFGAVLYEMTTGVRPFARGTSAETMAAILRDEPPEPARPLPPAVDRIVRHCLEKKPEARFQSAHDLAFALDAAAGSSSSSSVPVVLTPAAVDERRSRVPPWRAAAVILLIASAAAVGFATGARRAASEASTPAQVRFRQLTFDRGRVTNARFAPDGATVVYSALWNGGDSRLFLTRLEFAGSTSIGASGMRLFGVSTNAELAIGLNGAIGATARIERPVTVVRMPLLGGSAQTITYEVRFADWNPAGTELAVVRAVGLRERLEYPLGTVLFETAGEIGFPRVSPDGNAVAICNWPVPNDDRGTVTIVGRDKSVRVVSRSWEAVSGLAWRPDGREVWYTAASTGMQYALWSSRSSPSDERPVYAAPGGVLLLDIAKDGRALMSRYDRTMHVEGSFDGSPVQDFSWLDFSFARDISPDGRSIAFTYSGQGSSQNYDVYVRGVHDAEARRLGEGQAEQFSPDGASVLAVVHGPPSRVMLLPTGAGQPRTVSTADVTVVHARWLPDGRRLLLIGNAPGRGARAYVQNLSEGAVPQPMTPEGIGFLDQIALTLDGARVAFRSPEGRVTIYPIDGGTPTPANGFTDRETPIGWSADGRSLLIIDPRGRALVSIDPASGNRTVVRSIPSSDPALIGPAQVLSTRDGRSWVANYGRHQDTLFLVDGLR